MILFDRRNSISPHTISQHAIGMKIHDGHMTRRKMIAPQFATITTQPIAVCTTL